MFLSSTHGRRDGCGFGAISEQDTETCIYARSAGNLRLQNRWSGDRNDGDAASDVKAGADAGSFRIRGVQGTRMTHHNLLEARQ